MYALGIDLGTTVTGVAVWRDGRAEIAVGSALATVPSVVFLGEDGTFLAGNPALRRSAADPDRATDAFVRRLGDPVPIMLGEVPHSPDALTGRFVRALLDQVSAVEGGAPASLCVSYPVDWGAYQIHLLRESVRTAGVTPPRGVRYVTVAQAAATHYAEHENVPLGATVAVCGIGGTAYAAVLRRIGEGFDVVGRPDSVDLTGADVDQDLLDQAITVLRRAVDSAGRAAADLYAAVIVGDSSQLPVVAPLLSDDLGRPVTILDQPGQVVALGAALTAGAALTERRVPSSPGSRPVDGVHAPVQTAPPYVPGSAAPPTVYAPQPGGAALPDLAPRPAPPRSGRLPNLVGGGRRVRPKVARASDAISEAVRSSVTPGLVAFNPPHRMKQGHAERVEVEVARTTQLREEIGRKFRGRGDPVIEEISTSTFMGVQVVGRAFYVDSLSPQEQLVPVTGRWEFDVTPKLAGNHPLTLCVTMKISTPRGDGLIAVPVLERDIDVRVDVVYGARTFVSHNWQWLSATAIGLGGAISAWAALFR